MTETEAIRVRYARRPPSSPDIAIHDERNQAVEQFLNRLSSSRKTARVLDLGCGDGKVLRHLLRIGFESQNLTGVDLLEERIATARRNLPRGVRLACGDATEIGFESQNAHLALAFTVFSSALDSSYRKNLAARLWSAVQPGGAVLLYDFCFNNPFNKDVRAVSLSEVKSLFPNARMHARRLTVAPPLARVAASLHPDLYHWLSRIPFLRTHALVWLEKPAL